LIMKKMFFLTLALVLSLNALAINSDDRKIGTKILGYEPVTTAQRDALTGIQAGAVVWNASTGSLNFYDGSAWVNVAALTGTLVEASQYATTAQNGLLTKEDYELFFNKQPAGNYVTSIQGDIVSSGFASGVVTATLQNDTVSTAKIVNGAVTTAKIADGAVDSQKIADNAITAIHITDGVVGTAKIANGAITGDKIAMQSVDLASKVSGVLPMANGGTGLSVAGQDGSVLRSNGTDWVSSLLNSSYVGYVPSVLADWGVVPPSDVKGAIDELALRVKDVEGVDEDQLLKDGTVAMTGDLNMGSKKITLLADGIATSDAVNLGQLNTAIQSKDAASEISYDDTLTVFGAGINTVQKAIEFIDTEVSAEFTRIWGAELVTLSGSAYQATRSKHVYVISPDSTAVADFKLAGTLSMINGEVFNIVNRSSLSVPVKTFTNASIGTIAPNHRMTVVWGGSSWYASTSPVISNTNEFNMASAKIIGLANGTDANDAVNLSQLNAKADIGDLRPQQRGTRIAPKAIQTLGITVASGNMGYDAARQDIYVCGSSNGTDCNDNVVISTIGVGMNPGQRMCLIGRSSFTVELNSSTSNVAINGNAVLGVNDTICLRFDSLEWVEESRNF
jgi:hypothetical protein